jgi:hypothetical protein
MLQGVLPPAMSREYQSAVSCNEAVAEHVFKRVFLTRALLFDLFIDAMKAGNGTQMLGNYRCKWLLLQLQPSILHAKIWHPFVDLMHKLSACSNVHLNKMSKKVLCRIRSTLSRGATMPPSGCASVPLYCVVDEAQFAATQHTAAFCSTNPNDAIPCPVLHPLVQTISALTLGHGVFIVLMGTGLSQSSVDTTMASAVMKESHYRWCYDTGMFEGWDGMSSWVQWFMSDWVFEGPMGNRLKERMGYWLSGRSGSAFFSNA